VQKVVEAKDCITVPSQYGGILTFFRLQRWHCKDYLAMQFSSTRFENIQRASWWLLYDALKLVIFTPGHRIAADKRVRNSSEALGYRSYVTSMLLGGSAMRR
jgi:hypothetical protein